MDISSSPSPERKYSFGMGSSPSPSPEPKDHFKHNFRFHEPLFLLDPEDNFEMQVPVSPLPHAEDFGTSLSRLYRAVGSGFGVVRGPTPEESR